MSVKLGIKGIPAAAEEAMVARDLILAKLTKARLHIAHASTKRLCGAYSPCQGRRDFGNC